MTTAMQASERRWESESKLLDAIDSVVTDVVAVEGEEYWKVDLLLKLSLAYRHVEGGPQPGSVVAAK